MVLLILLSVLLIAMVVAARRDHVVPAVIAAILFVLMLVGAVLFGSGPFGSGVAGRHGAWLASLPVVKLLILPLALLIGMLARRGRGSRGIDYLDAAPCPGWEETSERFVDARSRVVIAVWYNPSTGRRAYVRAHRQGALPC